MVKVCSFTGHRAIEPHHREGMVELLMRAIAFAYDEGCRAFYIGGALGFDTHAAQQVLLFRMSHPDVTMNLVLPCRDQADKWEAAQADMYEYLLSQADTVEYVADLYTPGCMRTRNMRLASLCDIMIAYVGRERSGASQTARMATQLGKRVYNLYPALERGEHMLTTQA